MTTSYEDKLKAQVILDDEHERVRCMAKMRVWLEEQKLLAKLWDKKRADNDKCS